MLPTHCRRSAAQPSARRLHLLPRHTAAGADVGIEARVVRASVIAVAVGPVIAVLIRLLRLAPVRILHALRAANVLRELVGCAATAVSRRPQLGIALRL